MTGEIFISYSSSDREVAQEVCGSLESKGLDCWIAPRDVPPGMNYGKAIIHGINSCSVMVLVYSSRSDSSPQVLREVERAVSKNIIIIPIRIEEVTPSEDFEYYISTTHWLDAFEPPMDRHIDKLVDTINSILPGGCSDDQERTSPELGASLDEEVRSSMEEIEKNVSDSMKSFGGKEDEVTREETVEDQELEEDLDILRSAFIVGNFFSLYSIKGPEGGEKTEELLEAFDILDIGDYILDPLIEIRSKFGRSKKSKEIHKGISESMETDHSTNASSMFRMGNALMGITLGSEEFLNGSKYSGWRELEPFIKEAHDSINGMDCDISDVDLTRIRKMVSNPTKNRTYVEELVECCEDTIDLIYGI